jgi:N-methylhydantoinase A
VTPTVTDAAVVLGYVDPDFFLGGAIRLDRDAAVNAVAQHVAEPLGLGTEEAAWRILELATENMVQAIADITVAQGIDPATAALIGGGGAAGLNSTFIARRLGCPKLIIPETGAALSAAGAMMSDLAAEYAVSLFTTLSSYDAGKVADAVAVLAGRCDAFVERARETAIGAAAVSYVAEARYEGQVWDIDVPFDPQVVAAEGTARFRATFDALHEQIFAVRDDRSDIEIIGLRATVRARVREHEHFRLDAGKDDGASRGHRRAYFQDRGWCETPVLRLEALPAGVAQSGPAIIESAFTTIVVDPEARFERSAAGSIVITP